MDRVLNARYVESEEDFASKSGEVKEYQVEIRVNTPFTVVKMQDHDDDDMKMEDDEYEMADDDVMIRGAVYVGNEAMLDRHGELVDMGAIMNAWDKYKQNPVILYNHSKTNGVIGRMVDVSMEKMDGMDEEVPFGRAIIDGGEKDIVRKIRKGLLRAFSIGFIARAAVKECMDEDKCYVRFTEIEWLETSVVDVPASPNALFSVEKHIIGYEDMGDRIAILFEKPASEEAPAESPAQENSVIESDTEVKVHDSCGCQSDKSDSDEESEEVEESEEISPVGTFDSDLVGRLELLEAYVEALESKTFDTASFNTPLAQPVGQRGNEMTQEEIIASEKEAEEVVVKMEEEASEEPVVEEATELEVSEEVVEEVAEATEEESFEEEVVVKEADEPSTNDILIEVVKTLAGIDERIAGLEAKMVVEDLSEEVASLKAELEAKDAELAEFKAKAEEMAKEAEIEAEVSKRIAERIGDSPAVVKTADPKSLSPVVKEDITRHDPQPNVSKGMNGLAVWLEQQLISKRGA